MDSLKKQLKRLSRLTGTEKVHPHHSSHGKSPHSGYNFGTEMKEIPKSSGGKKRTRRVKHRRSKHRKSSRKPKHRTLKRKNVKSRKFMRGGMEEDETHIEMTELPKTGTIVLTGFPIPREGFNDDNSLKEHLKKRFFVKYNLLGIISPTNKRDMKTYAQIEIIKISETADGDNLLTIPIECIFALPRPPSESYTLSASHRNPSYIKLGPSESKYMILEII